MYQSPNSAIREGSVSLLEGRNIFSRTPLPYFYPQRKQSPGRLQLPASHLHRRKMKLGCVLPPLLGLLMLSSVEEAALSADGANSVRLPEHTCQKTIGTAKCKPGRCEQECSLEPKGRGECIADACSCSFYCLRPPA